MGFFPYYYLFNNPFKIYEHRVISGYLKRNNLGTVLDLGCGNGTQTILNANKFKRIIGIDPDKNAIMLAKKKLAFNGDRGNVEFYASCLEDMNFASNSIDGVISYCVLEHIQNYEEILSEIYRILKPGGFLLITVDSLAVIRDKKLLDKHKDEHHVVKYFNVREIRELLIEKQYEKILVMPELSSEYAERIFAMGIKNQFRYGKCSSLIKTILLYIFESNARRENGGLFLTIKAQKKGIDD